MHVHSAKYWRWHHDQECSGLPWALTHLQQHASNNMVPPTKSHNAHSILKTELECDCCAASASSQPECMTQWMPSPSGGHNSSMPLATLRAQSITDSHNHFTGPWAPDFQLAAIPHTLEKNTPGDIWPDCRVTVLLMHPGDKSLKISVMRMPNAELLLSWAHSSTLGKASYDASCPAARLKGCYGILN